MEELEQTPQMNRRSAESVYHFSMGIRKVDRTGRPGALQAGRKVGTCADPDDRAETDFKLWKHNDKYIPRLRLIFLALSQIGL